MRVHIEGLVLAGFIFVALFIMGNIVTGGVCEVMVQANQDNTFKITDNMFLILNKGKVEHVYFGDTEGIITHYLVYVVSDKNYDFDVTFISDTGTTHTLHVSKYGYITPRFVVQVPGTVTGVMVNNRTFEKASPEDVDKVHSVGYTGLGIISVIALVLSAIGYYFIQVDVGENKKTNDAV